MFEQWSTSLHKKAKVKRGPLNFLRAEDGVIDALLIHRAFWRAGNGVVFNQVSRGWALGRRGGTLERHGEMAFVKSTVEKA